MDSMVGMQETLIWHGKNTLRIEQQRTWQKETFKMGEWHNRHGENTPRFEKQRTFGSDI